MRKRRILSLLTALALCLSLLPVTALAEGMGCDGTECGHVAAIGNIHYNSLADAIDAVQANGAETTIKLLSDTIDGTVIEAGKDVVLNLNNKNVNVTSGSSGSGVITVNGKLTIQNGTLTDTVSGKSNYFIYVDGELNIADTATLTSTGYVIYGTSGDAEITTSGDLTSNDSDVIYINSGNSLTINGGTITASGSKKSCVVALGGTITMNDGILVANGTESYCIKTQNDRVEEVDILGGSLTASGSKGYAVYWNSGGTLTIGNASGNGPTLTAGDTAIEVKCKQTTINTSKVIVQGGTLNGTKYTLYQNISDVASTSFANVTLDNVYLRTSSSLTNCTINGTLTLGSNECTFDNMTFGTDAQLSSTLYKLTGGQVVSTNAPEITFATNDADMGLIKIDNYEFSNPSSSGGFSDPMKSKTWYVNSGSTATVTATAVPADQNHEFVGWYPNADGSGTQLSDETTVIYTADPEEGVTENVSYYAVFKETDEYAAMRTAAAEWANETSPTISSKEHMRYFAYAVNELGKDFSDKTVKLEADLTYTDADSFTPIGTAAHPFKGTFDGGSNTITGLSAVGTYYTDEAGSYLGLFGYTSGAEIKNLTLSGVDFYGAYMAGGFAGEANSTTFTNCTLTGVSKVSNAYFTGGLFGHSSGVCTVTGCKVENSELDGNWKTGGITGYADGVTISGTTVNNTEVDGPIAGALIGHANAGNTALTNVTVADVTDGEQKKINVIGTTYNGENSHSITVSGDSTNIDAAGLVPSESTASVQVDGGDFTFVIPDEYVSNNTNKISVTFKNGEEIVIVHVIDRGGTVTLPAAPTKDNHIFKGWYVGGTKITGKTTFTVNTVVNAQWSEIPVFSGGVTPPTHDISVDSGSHGDVEVWPEEAKQGTTVTITATPDKGYEVADVTVTAENGKEITVTDKGNNKYTFMMPGSDVTIAVTFQPVSGGSTSGDLTITAPAGWVNPYTDVAANAWYYDAVGYATANGLMGGVGSNAFDPSGSMNRAMVWTVIARLAGQSISGSTWAEDARTWAMAQGVSDGTNPDGAVSREELVTMLYRYAGSPAMNVPELALIGNYPDSADVSAWAQNAFAWAISKGIIEGRDGKLAAGEVLTRAEAATILARFHLLTK